LFGVFENRAPGESSAWFAKLNGANLQGADLSQVGVFLITGLPQPYRPQNKLPPDLPFVGRSATWNDPIRHEDARALPVYVVLFSGSDLVVREPASRFVGLFQIVEELLRAENLEQAKMPASLRWFVETHKNPAYATQDRSVCKPRSENLKIP